MANSAEQAKPGPAATEDVLFERRGGVGLITLNRPKALNALNLDMLRALDPQLHAWARDSEVQAVVIRGAGDRAFCAGGDVRALYDSRARGDRAYRAAFYRQEYNHNRSIFRFPKPYVALVDGIVMGGGVGVSIHGSHRIATERTLFAMPETGIGLFPDVGAGSFLPRMPGMLGFYLGLSGTRLKAADCLYAKIATDYVPAARLDELVHALAAADLAGGVGAVAQVVARFREAPEAPPIAQQQAAIDRCFAAPTMEGILELLDREGGEWARGVRATLATKSPTSLKLTLRQLQRGPALIFEEVMKMEYRLSQYCMDGHDFFEGVRAVIVDKDNAPRWQPATLAEVAETEIGRAFAPRADDLQFS